jgi:hypothetical protein
MTQLASGGGNLYYRHSGRTPIVRLLAALAAVVPAALVMAVIYGAAAVYLPKVGYVKLVLILAAFLVIGFGFGVGGVTGYMLKWARVRSIVAVALVSVLAAALAYYVSWVTWETLVLRREGVEVLPLRLLARPDGVWYLATMINETGTIVFGTEETPIRGPVLWVLWVVEAAVVLGIGSQVPVRMLRHLAYCEPCDRWCDRHQAAVSVGYGDESALRSRLERKDLAVLQELGQPDLDGPHRFRVDLDNCPHCQDTHLLSVFRVDVTYRKGNRQEKAVRLIDRLRVSPAEAQWVRDLRDRQWAPQEPAGETEQEEEGEGEEEEEEDQDQAEPGGR